MSRNIVFIDGYCVLCNGFAKYIIKHQKKEEIFISSLQGDLAQDIISSELLKNTDSVVYYKNEKVLIKSSAALHILADIGGWRKILKVFLIVPRPLRDWVYSGIAKRRYKWFGKKETCEIPTEENSKQILA